MSSYAQQYGQVERERVDLDLPANGQVWPAWGYTTPEGVCIRFIDFLVIGGEWVSGWIYWPEMVRAGLLRCGSIIPGTWGDFPLFVTDAGMKHRK